jgi:hypothetical protein
MPEAAIFFHWVAEHPELSQQFRAKGKLHKMLAEQNELTKKEERSQAKYRARAWEETYSLIGAPPVLSRESKAAYAQLLTVFTERLQPQDIIAQFMVKQAVDATWEEIRFAREKTQLLEQAQQDAGGLEKKFPYYQALDRAQMQAARRRAHALRDFERWNKGLGRKARELSDRIVWAETICPAKPPAQDPAPFAPAQGEEMITQTGRVDIGQVKVTYGSPQPKRV